MGDTHDSSSESNHTDDDLGLAALGLQIAADDIDNLAQEARLSERLFGDVDEPMQLGQRWILRAHLGRGASGTVHAAYDKELTRTVALKILKPRPDLDPVIARYRLLREAKALARISHPNVIQIHDVRIEGDEVYLVMEHMDGGSLRRWQETEHSLDQILDVYLQAARGLSRVHAAKLVHRDFKPENALIDQQGRVVVIDLGLVHAIHEGRVEAEIQQEEGDSELDRSITRTGDKLGTLAYMAPEQLEGEPTNARSDQFAFCLALYEAIGGVHPFSGEDIDYAVRLELIHRGKFQPTRMPAWLARVLVRGLSMRPDDRYPDMDALVRAIERGRRKRWPRFAAYVGMAILAGSSLFMAVRPAPPPDCGTEAEEEFRAAWNTNKRTTMRKNLLDAGLSEPAWGELEEVLDDRAEQWKDDRTEACDDQRRMRTESERELAVQRDACLTRARRATESRIDSLTNVPAAGQGPADRTVADMAERAAEALRHGGDCAHPESWRLASLPPENPIVAAVVAYLRTLIAGSESLELHGHEQKAERLAQEIIAAAEPLGYVPVRVEAMYQLGHVLGTQDDYEDAATLLRQTAELAAEHHLFAMEADAWLYLLKLAADGFQDPLRTGAWLTDTRNALLRSHVLAAARIRAAEDTATGEADPAWKNVLAELDGNLHPGAEWSVLAEYLEARGMLAYLEERSEEAIVLHRRALAIRQKLPGSGWLVSKSLNNLGNALQKNGKFKEAQARYEEALGLRMQLYGPEHPMVAQMHFSIGRLAGYRRGDFERGREELERALALYRRSYAADDPRLLLTLLALAYNEYASRMLDRAEELTREISDRHRRLHEVGDPVSRRLDRAQEHLIVAAVHDVRGRPTEALAEVTVAIEIYEEHQVQKTRSEQSALYVWSLHDAGQLLGKMKQWNLARPWFEKALVMYECCSPVDQDLECSIPTELARTLRALGVEPERGRALERAASTRCND